MNNQYRLTFGIKSRHKKSKAEKGNPGIGFKLTYDNNYDMDYKRLTNVGEPGDQKDAINKDYFDSEVTKFHTKNEDIDMNGKAIKNLPWPNEINDALPKKYLYQYGLLLDSKLKFFNAKDNKIGNVLDPEDLTDAATKKYVDNLDLAKKDSMTELMNKSYRDIREEVKQVDRDIRDEVTQVDSKIRNYLRELALKISADLRAYVDDKNLFKSKSYKLELNDIISASFDTIDSLHLFHVRSYIWCLSGSIKLKETIKMGNRILIAVLPKQFPRPAKTKYFTYFKKKNNEQKVIIDVGFITGQNELGLFLPLEDKDEIIFDSMLDFVSVR